MASKKKKPAPKKKAKASKPARKAAKPAKKTSAKAKKPAKKPVKKAAPKPAKKSARKEVKKVVKKAPVAKAKQPAPKANAAPKPAPKAPVKVAPPVKANAKPGVPAAKPAPAAKAPAPVAAPKAAPKKKPEIPKVPMTVVMTGVDPLSGPVRTLKRALKERFTVEIYIHSTPFALYELISTPSGFSKWFCDDVNVRGEEFTFVWGNDEQSAEVLSRKQGELIRMHWTDDDDEGSFFELRIRIDPLTNEVALVITDHAWPNELEKARQLWESQIHTLQRVLGA